MTLNGIYAGCINSGNVGDDILWSIFVRKLSMVLGEKYSCPVSVTNKDLPDPRGPKDIGIVGGGSLLHPEECSYIQPAYSGVSMLFGTGMTDTGRCKFGLRSILLIRDGKEKKVSFHGNRIMRINEEAVAKIRFGGFRGPLDCHFFRQEPGNRKGYIYDSGLLADQCFPGREGIPPDLFDVCPAPDMPVVSINLAWVSGAGRIMREGDNGDDVAGYNHFITDRLSEVADRLSREGWAILCVPLSGELAWHANLKEKILARNKDAIVARPVRNLTFREVLDTFHSSRLVVGTRLHASVLAASVGTPFITMAYGFKHLNFARSVGAEDYLVLAHDFSADDVMGLARRLGEGEERVEVVGKLRSHVSKAEALYSEHVSRLLDAAAGGGRKPSSIDLVWGNGISSPPFVGRFDLTFR